MRIFSKEFCELAASLPDPGTSMLACSNLDFLGPEIKVEWSKHEEMFVATFEEHPALRAVANTKEAAIQKMERLIDEEDKRVYGEIVLR